MFVKPTRSLGSVALVAALAAAMPAGAEVITYTTTMSGPAESPPNNSPGTGTAIIDIDTVAHTLRVRAQFEGLLGTTSAAHIHAATAVPFQGTAGVATQLPSFMGFPLGVTSGSMDQTFDTSLASTWSATYITNNGGTPLTAEAAFAAALAQGRAYFNVHSSMFPGGEIRGFLPAPGAATLLALGGLAAARRRRA